MRVQGVRKVCRFPSNSPARACGRGKETLHPCTPLHPRVLFVLEARRPLRRPLSAPSRRRPPHVARAKVLDATSGGRPVSPAQHLRVSALSARTP